MYNLLIVDDEAVILKGIYKIIKKNFDDQFNLFMASDGDEALQVLSETQMHIIVTDVQMPGTDGLELQEIVMQKWPSCKVIFLTCHDDFNYIKKALHNNSVDYLLKSESHEKLIEAIKKALNKVIYDEEYDELKKKIFDTVNKARNNAQKNIILEILQGEQFSGGNLKRLFSEFSIKLDVNHDVLLVLGKCTETSGCSITELPLQHIIVQNITNEFLNKFALVQSIYYQKNKYAWLLQPKKPLIDDGQNVKGELKGALMNSKISCVNNYCLDMSFYVADKEYNFNDLSEKFNALDMKLESSQLFEESFINFENMDNDKSYTEKTTKNHDSTISRRLIKELKQLYQEKDKEGFIKKFNIIYEKIFLDEKMHNNVKMETYLQILLFIYSSINQSSDYSNNILLDSINNNISWHKLNESILDAATQNIHNRDNNKNMSIAITEKINDYILDNLDRKLSLSEISNIVFLSSSYLSRLYKQTAGISISDYILNERLNKAKILLSTTNMKMDLIAKEIGYENNSSYFYRLFKKRVGLTPNEYRLKVKK